VPTNFLPRKRKKCSVVLLIGNRQTIDPGLEHIRWFKHHDAPRGYRNFDPGLGISPNALRLGTHEKPPKRRQFDGIAPDQSIGQFIQHRLYQNSRLLPRQTDATVYGFREIDTRNGTLHDPSGSIDRLFRDRRSKVSRSTHGFGFCHPSTPLTRFSHAKNDWSGNRLPDAVQLRMRTHQALARSGFLANLSHPVDRKLWNKICAKARYFRWRRLAAKLTSG
jgi:hypothetical protein